ncbi:hypothetical protein DOY81_003801 [Sarcophaga bullata]|nr:hypothetical protein DOY81_003801 [Sarcophaga bullata]
MSEDVVEIIENCPEIIEISDETDEGSKDFIEITYDSEDLENENNENGVIAIKEETSESTDLGGNTTDVEHLNEICEVVEAETTNNTTNTCRTNTRNIKIGNSRRKRRKKFRGRLVNAANGANQILHTANSPNGIYDKVARSNDAFSPENTENFPLNQIIKEENEITTGTSRTDEDYSGDENIASQTISISDNSHRNNPNTSSSTTVPRQMPCDYSKLRWLKPLNSLSSPPHLQLVIIDRSHPDWRIGTEKWLMIEKRLLEHLHCEMLRSNDSSIGLFDGAKWQRGIKIVGCHNEKALNFVKNFILNLDKLWTGAKLDVFPMAYIVRQICKVFIPPPILKTDVVLSLIKLQNPSISTDDWEVLGERKRNHGIDIWLSISEQSYQHLRRSRGELKYGINRIFLNPIL